MCRESVKNYTEEGEESDSGEIVGGEKFVSGGRGVSSFAAKVKTVFEASETRSFTYL
jgi:hypothetical protein